MNPEAQEFLQSLEGVKLGVVAVCGKYRTGKSYLLNKLFVETYFQNLSNTSILGGGSNTTTNKETEDKSTQDIMNMTASGFQVSPTINPCTKGLWIWKKVIYSDQNDCPMIVIDTEGLGAFDEDENHDAKIFLLAMLLSSLLIYNSVGTIDENALNNLSLVINLSKKIQLRNSQETPEDVDELASIFPAFIWVLRDFTLKLVDADGNRISSRQYLENALKEQKGFSEVVEQKNRVRRLLKHVFQERDCCTLIRPTEKERDLQDLAKLRDSQLRKDFVDQMKRLKHKVMTKVKVKVMNGHSLNGPMLVDLAKSYITALNQGQVPNIENAWSNVCLFEQERAYKDSVQLFEKEVNDRIKNNFQEVGSDNIKIVLNEIKDITIQHLKSKFLGDNKTYATFETKLKHELKTQSSAVFKETQLKIDELIKESIAKSFSKHIESRVRKGDPELDSLDKLNQEIDHLLTLVQIKFVNDGERVEVLYRKYVQQKLFKVIEILNENERMKQQVQIRLLEERLKINEAVIQQQKEEKKGWVEDYQYEKDKVELERVEFLKKEKIMEQKLKDMEAKMHLMTNKLKEFSVKDHKNQLVQTVDREDTDQGIQVSLEQKQINPEENNLKESFISAVDENDVITKMPITLNQFEQNKKLYSEILEALNNQSKQISQTIKEEFGEILKNNQSLSKAIEQSEKRCMILEKKLERKRKYEDLVKNCQRLQCNGCNKLYTPMLFVTHYLICKKQQQLKTSFINENNQDNLIKEDQEKVVSEEQFLAKIVDMKQIYVDARDGCISDNCYGYEASSASDDLVTIGGGRSPMKTPHKSTANQYFTVQFKICVLFNGCLWYINRTLAQIKSLMNKTQREKYTTDQEKCQIAKWIIEIERNEIEENYQKIAEIFESFIQSLYRRVIDNQMTIASYFEKIQIEDVEQGINKSGFLHEFIEFFEIKANNNARADEDYNDHDNMDDEVVVQMTYDDDIKTESDVNLLTRPSAIGATIQSAISELCGTSALKNQGFGMTASRANCYNHSTIHLDGEKSMNDNSSLHFVSFFSVAEELLMKKNLLLGKGLYGGSSSHLTSQNNDDKAEVEEQSEESLLARDENFVPGSPSKVDRKIDYNQQPFGSISNRPSNLISQCHPQPSSVKPVPFDPKQQIPVRKSQSPYLQKRFATPNGLASTKRSLKKTPVNGLNSNKKSLKNCQSTAKKYRPGVGGIMYTE